MKHSLLLTSIFVFTLILAGCGGTPKMHYYQLTPMEAPSEQVTETRPDLALGVGPIRIPEILKRQEVVTRSTDNQLRVATQHRWAGLLEKDITAAVTENLGRQLGTEQVLDFPWPSYFDPDYRVVIDLLDLTGNPENLVTLRAAWMVVDGAGEQVLVRKISEFQQQAAEQTVDAMVGAQNLLVAQLCEEISAALRAQ